MRFKNQKSHGVTCGQGKFDGVNLRYNYGPNFTTSNDFCNDFFPGISKESEPETVALINWIKNPFVKIVIGVFK